MALAHYEGTGLEAAPLYRADSALSPYETDHVRTYRKFVRLARLAACAVPFFVAFILYWTY